MVQSLAAIAALVTATGVSAQGPLDRLIAFDEPYRCVAGKDFGALLDTFVRWMADSEARKARLDMPRVPTSFEGRVGHATMTVDGDEYRANLPLQGTWRGLPLRSLVVTAWADSESGFYLIFDAPPDAVRHAANNAGFRIPPSGSEYRDDEVLGVTVGVDAYDGSGALYCING